ncbi:MAG: aspartate-semialdehyde dehydrogenase [Candidatus Eisenbacteria bacterium]
MTRGRRVVSIVGATGLVGSEIARLLCKRKFPLSELLLFSSGRNPERETTLGGRSCDIHRFRPGAAEGSDICFLAAGGEFSRRHAAAIAKSGCTVIDNSSALRMRADVPLVVPEVNAADLKHHTGIIANPNCSTIQMVVALAPLHRRWGLRRVIVSTYQSVSGAGLRAAGELATQSSSLLEGAATGPDVFVHPIGFNLIPHIDTFDDEGWTREERKMVNETRKILGDESIDVVATAVRVPVFRGHSEAVYAEFDRPVDLVAARRVLERAPGVAVEDDPSRNLYPTPLNCAGKDDTFVGRLRLVPGHPNALCMWIVSDNLLKGAALNAVQIAEELL